MRSRRRSSLADLIASNLLAPDRAARLVEQRALDPSLPGLGDVIDRLLRAATRPAGRPEYEAEIARAVQHVVVDNVIALADRAPMPQVRAVATLKLRQRMRDWSAPAPPGQVLRTESRIAMNAYLADEIKRFLDRPSTPAGAWQSPRRRQERRSAIPGWTGSAATLRCAQSTGRCGERALSGIEDGRAQGRSTGERRSEEFLSVLCGDELQVERGACECPELR